MTSYIERIVNNVLDLMYFNVNVYVVEKVYVPLDLANNPQMAALIPKILKHPFRIRAAPKGKTNNK